MSSKKNSTINIKVNINIREPFCANLPTIFSLSKIKKFKILKASTNTGEVLTQFSWDSFKKMFGCNPQKKKMKTPKGSEQFIEEVEVIEIFVKE